MPLELRTDKSLPAFTGCSLDDDPGNGDPADGDPEGQSNLYLAWDPESIRDDAGTWQITVRLIEKSSKPECTVNITPRRLQHFKPKPGQTYKWTNATTNIGAAIQTGRATADEHGLIALEDVKVGRTGNRITISLESRQ